MDLGTSISFDAKVRSLGKESTGGLQVRLVEMKDGLEQAVVKQTLTDKNGIAAFDDILPADYRISVNCHYSMARLEFDAGTVARVFCPAAPVLLKGFPMPAAGGAVAGAGAASAAVSAEVVAGVAGVVGAGAAAAANPPGIISGGGDDPAPQPTAPPLPTPAPTDAPEIPRPQATPTPRPRPSITIPGQAPDACPAEAVMVNGKCRARPSSKPRSESSRLDGGIADKEEDLFLSPFK